MILMYHKVYLESPTMWWVTVNNFYRQMVEISNKEVVFLDDYSPDNPNHVVITFDGIYDNVLLYAAPILKHFGYPFELFFTSAYLGKDSAFDTVEPVSNFTTIEQLTKLKSYGGRLQWHTKTHLNLKNINNLESINNELSIPEHLTKLDSNGFKWFAYPHGEFNELVLSEVKKRFIGALSCHQGSGSDAYELNRLTVTNKTKLRDEKIACIIASYNYGDYLIEAIESVLSQTLVPDEILITDDCSDDETQIIAESYVNKYPNLISYNRNETNLGIVENFNKAISLTDADLICFLGADNRFVSNYIEKTFTTIRSNPQIGVAYTDYAFFGSRAKIKYEKMSDELKSGVIDDYYYQIKFPEYETLDKQIEEINKRNFIHGSSLFRKQAFDEVGGYKETNVAEDYNLFKRMLNAGWMAAKASTNLEYRQHSEGQANNISVLNNKLQFYKRAHQKVLREKQQLENSKGFKYYVKAKKILKFIKKNIKKPQNIIKKILKS